MHILIGIVIGVVAGLVAGFVIKGMADKRAGLTAQDVTKSARREADTILKEAQVSAKEELIKRREEFEKSTEERKRELKKLEERLDGREANIERKADLMEHRMRDIDTRENRLREREEQLLGRQDELEAMIGREMAELERVSGLTRDEGRRQLLDRLNHELEAERGGLIRRFHEETTEQIERESQEIMINAMERFANDCAYERTTSTIPLPNDEMKGRIIGREGRNIRTIEAATGVSVLIDDTPEAVVISCFDPVRRVIARTVVERLVADGRIHPTRIEEMVNKVKSEIEAEIIKAGREAVQEVGLTNVRPNIVKLLGRLKYRYSYSQNVLEHSKECAFLMGAIAAQLGIDEQTARRAGMFHDLGKAVDHEVEGSHAVIGADLLKRAGESDEICNAVGAHHEDTEKTSLLGILVCICDTLSASRPGARSETTELYLKRIEQLESIGKSVPGVENCFAIQAGRELRVVVEPGAIDENRAALVAREIANQIEKDVRYPGSVQVTVVRETRSVDYAR